MLPLLLLLLPLLLLLLLLLLLPPLRQMAIANVFESDAR